MDSPDSDTSGVEEVEEAPENHVEEVDVGAATGPASLSEDNSEVSQHNRHLIPTNLLARMSSPIIRKGRISRQRR